MKLTDLVKGNNAVFQRYRNNHLVYRLKVETPNENLVNAIHIDNFEFEIPVEELEGATVNSVEKASVFLKWIRRALKEIVENDD